MRLASFEASWGSFSCLGERGSARLLRRPTRPAVAWSELQQRSLKRDCLSTLFLGLANQLHHRLNLLLSRHFLAWATAFAHSPMATQQRIDCLSTSGCSWAGDWRHHWFSHEAYSEVTGKAGHSLSHFTAGFYIVFWSWTSVWGWG